MKTIHTDGRYVKDSDGVTVTLKGVNFAQFIDYANGNWIQKSSGNIVWNTWDTTNAQAALDAMKSWGCNCVRTLATVQWWTENTDNFRQHIKDWIAWADQRGLYVVLNFWRVSGASTCIYPVPPFNTDANDNAILGSEQAFIDFWASVASELKDYPNVLFSLWNEPNGDQGATPANWMSTAQKCITAIRATGAQNLVVVQWGYNILPTTYQNPSPWSLDWIENYPLTGSNILYSTHLYWAPTDQNWSDMTYESLKNGYGNNCLINHVLNDLGKPLWIGEIGANLWWGAPQYPPENLRDELMWFGNALKWFNEIGVGYAGWGWLTQNQGQAYYLLVAEPDFPPSDAGKILINSIKGTAANILPLLLAGILGTIVYFKVKK